MLTRSRYKSFTNLRYLSGRQLSYKQQMIVSRRKLERGNLNRITLNTLESRIKGRKRVKVKVNRWMAFQALVPGRVN